MDMSALNDQEVLMTFGINDCPLTQISYYRIYCLFLEIFTVLINVPLKDEGHYI